MPPSDTRQRGARCALRDILCEEWPCAKAQTDARYKKCLERPAVWPQRSAAKALMGSAKQAGFEVVGEAGIEPATPDLEGRVYPITRVYSCIEVCSVFRPFERFGEPRSLKRLLSLSLEGPHKSPHNFQRQNTDALKRYSASPAHCSARCPPSEGATKKFRRPPKSQTHRRGIQSSVAFMLNPTMFGRMKRLGRWLELVAG